MKSNLLPEDAQLSDYVSVAQLAHQLDTAYGIIYYRILRDAIPTFILKDQQRPLFIKKRDVANIEL